LPEPKFDFKHDSGRDLFGVFSFSSHKLWVEQPENFPTCLALKPYPKESSNKKITFKNSSVLGLFDPDPLV
jgi:hypothetical protein